MPGALSIVIGILAVAFFVWLFIPTKSTAPPSDAAGNPLIDPDDSYQIGMLVGLTGGSIPDAAVMRYALDRFKQIHGRPATTQDIGIVLGLINSQNGGDGTEG
jgi:hypothetical protein